jgi:hypothetical protein
MTKSKRQTIHARHSPCTVQHRQISGGDRSSESTVTGKENQTRCGMGFPSGAADGGIARIVDPATAQDTLGILTGI